jgi:hypothetical protein
MPRGYFATINNKRDFDWFLKKFNRYGIDYPHRYKECIEYRLGMVCLCYDDEIGQNEDNGYLESAGFIRIYPPKITEYYEQLLNH